MDFDLPSALPILRRTPDVLRTLLHDLPEPWVRSNEGESTWSPFDVVGHLIHGERTDWLPRVQHILAHGESLPFPPFDRFAQFEASAGRSLAQLLEEFQTRRAANLRQLEALQLTPADFKRTGQHPALGRVTLGELLSTWVVHDLDHLVQIARVMGRQYATAVGPWREYLRIVRPT